MAGNKNSKQIESAGIHPIGVYPQEASGVISKISQLVEVTAYQPAVGDKKSGHGELCAEAAVPHPGPWLCSGIVDAPAWCTPSWLSWGQSLEQGRD